MTKNDLDSSKIDKDSANTSENNLGTNDFNTAYGKEEKTVDILGNIEEINNNSIDINTLSTFLTDSDIRPEELKKMDEEKKQIPTNQESSIVFDINLASLNDIINILISNQYDFGMIEPNSEYVKIVFKKDGVVKEVINIKFHIYSNILIQAKKISKLNLEETNIEQKGSGEYKFKDKTIEVLSRTIPSNFGETLYIKTKISDKVIEKKQNIKKTVSAGTAFGFLGAILFISLILGASFLTFVIFNAKTPGDVSFFASLGINLNDVNSFLLNITTVIFSIVILVEIILLIIFLFKALLTKKEFKRKKTILFIVSIILLIISFATGALWMKLDQAIKNLPNWQEMSYGNVQIFDNNLLKSPNFNKKDAIISNYTNIIGPIELKFDLTYLQKDEARRGFNIQKYIWDFGFGDKIETQTPEIIQNFNKKGNYKISLTLEGIDKRFPDKISQKPASGIPTISVSQIVKITENTLENGGKTISFDASDLKSLGEIEWYYKDDLTKPAFVGDYFQPSKIYFEEDAIGMLIKNDSNKNGNLDRVFIISGEKSKISGEIKETASIDDDLNYTLRLEKLENNSGAGFIKSFKWILENKEIIKEANILNLEDSSEINFNFTKYGKQIVKVILTNTAGKSIEIKKEVDIPKRLKTKNLIEFSELNSKMENVKYDEKTREYSIYELGVPTKITFDAKYIIADNPLYRLDEISWDVGSDGSIESKEKSLDYNFDLPGFKEVTVNYKFVHRKEKKDIINIKDKITLELVEKEAIVYLDAKTDSEYVPAIGSFDASLSKVKNDNIVKFIYDYGDGIIEERDAINPGHKYLKEGTYKVKLTIITEKGKEYSTSKTLILKSPLSEGKITVSLKKAPINQEIDFLSTGSVGQITSFHWDFGDGNTSNEANPSYSYETTGKYKVVLTLEYANNNIATQDVEIEITE